MSVPVKTSSIFKSILTESSVLFILQMQVWQGEKRSQCYSLSSISNAARRSRNRHKRYTKNSIAPAKLTISHKQLSTNRPTAPLSLASMKYLFLFRIHSQVHPSQGSVKFLIDRSIFKPDRNDISAIF